MSRRFFLEWQTGLEHRTRPVNKFGKLSGSAASTAGVERGGDPFSSHRNGFTGRTCRPGPIPQRPSDFCHPGFLFLDSRQVLIGYRFAVDRLDRLESTVGLFGRRAIHHQGVEVRLLERLASEQCLRHLLHAIAMYTPHGEKCEVLGREGEPPCEPAGIGEGSDGASPWRGEKLGLTGRNRPRRCHHFDCAR